MVLRCCRRADRVAHPVVEGADAGEEADRRGRQRADEDDDLAEPDRVPAAPPAAEHDDPAADPEEERHHPRGAQQSRVEEAAPAPRRRRRPVAHSARVAMFGDARHGAFFSAHVANAVGSITTTRERISACPSPQSSVQIREYVPTLFGVMWSVGWSPGTRSCFCLNSGTQNEWSTSFACMVSTTERSTGRRRTGEVLLP